jgi:hypothetical protein
MKRITLLALTSLMILGQAFAQTKPKQAKK